jgi:hypothetical protein
MVAGSEVMSNIHKIIPENREPGARQAIVLLPGSFAAVNRILFWLFACLMILAVFLGFLLFPANSLLTDIEQRQRSAANPALYAEVSALKGQLAGMVGSSIESKLRSLEENIRADNVSAVDLGTIQLIKNDLKLLRDYSEPSRAATANRQTSVDTDAVMLSNGQLLSEFAHLKYLLYFSIASCALMIAAVGGIWLQHRYRIGHSGVEKLSGKNGR